jgi:hypothetical protein
MTTFNSKSLVSIFHSIYRIKHFLKFLNYSVSNNFLKHHMEKLICIKNIIFRFCFILKLGISWISICSITCINYILNTIILIRNISDNIFIILTQRSIYFDLTKYSTLFLFYIFQHFLFSISTVLLFTSIIIYNTY